MTWQNLIRDWLRRTAQQRLQEAMAIAAQGGVATEAAAPQVPAAHVAVIFAQQREAVGLIDRLDGMLTIDSQQAQVYEGGLEGQRVAIAVCRANDAQAVTEAVIAGHRPQTVLAAGFATALRPEIAEGDLIVATQMVTADRPSSTCMPLPDDAGRPGWHVGRLLSVAGIPAEADQRLRLGEQHKALAAEVIAHGIVTAAAQHEVPCAVLYAVRYAVAQQASPALDRLRRKQPLSRRIGLLAGILGRPSTIKNVWHEKENDLIAADRLADGIAMVIRTLDAQRAKDTAEPQAALEGPPASAEHKEGEG